MRRGQKPFPLWGRLNKRSVERNQSTFALPAVRAWLRKTIENSVKCATVKLPAISGPSAQVVPKRAMKLLRKIASGYLLFGVLDWGMFWLFKKVLSPVLTTMVRWLLEHGYIMRKFVIGWALTDTGRALATKHPCPTI